MIVAAPTSFSVIGIRILSSSQTGCCVTDTSPKSPSNNRRRSQSK